MYISGCRVQNAAMSAVSIPEGDDYFNLVTLLLPGTGTNGAQNNTFLDSSSSSVTVTRNGTPTQGTFSPFSQTGWSGYFDGSGDCLRTTALNISSGNFTIEAWVNLTTMPTTDSWPGSYSNWMVIVGVGSASMADGWQFRIGQTILAFGTNNDTTAVSGTHGITAGSWNHLACVRNENVYTLYVNGFSVATATYTANQPGTGAFTWVGSETNQGAYLNGYISNLRILAGTSFYTTNFTPPTSPLTAITNTSLLTCQSNRFIDNSINAFAISALGDASVQAFAPFNPTQSYSNTVVGGSEYMVRTDYLTVPANAALKTFTGDFTIESWVYPLTTSGAVGGGGAGFIDTRTNGATAAPWVFGYGGYVAGSGFTLSYFDGSDRASSLRMPVNQWSHVAMTRQGSTLRFFINGVVDPTTYSVGGTINGGTNPLFITNSKDYAINSAWGSEGYWADFRIVNGTAVYTSSFTPPTAPLTAITNTTLLLNFTNGGILDATSKNNLQTVGGAAISTAQSKFGGSSMAFDGSGDYLLSPFSQINRINTTGNFTIEFWAYFNTVGADQRLIGWDNNTTGLVIAIYTNTTGNLAYYLSSTGTSWNIATAVSIGGIVVNTWYHIALVRNGSTFTPYINGVAGTATTSSATLASSTLPFSIGAVGNGQSPFNGYIDDFRITRGLARYTASFTPPTQAFPLL
jgi:hypothetical protein